MEINWSRRLLFLAGGGLAGLALVVLGVWLLVPHGQKTEISIDRGRATAEAQAQLTVDVAGAVLHPGVYKLDGGARVGDALAVAGGLTGEADASWFEKNINRAAKLKDGDKVRIPFIGDSDLKSAGSAGVVAGVSSKLVSVNSASQPELEALPGIGPATAGKIIAGRPYQKLDELVSKKVLSQSLFDKLKDSLAL